jgi:seryl-tRNA synthetase
MLAGTPKPRPTSSFSVSGQCCSILTSQTYLWCLPAKSLFSSSACCWARKFIRDTTVSTLPPPRLSYRSFLESPQYHAENIKNRKIRRAKYLVEDIQLSHAKHAALLAGVNNARHQQNEVGDKIRLALDERSRNAALNQAKELKNFLTIQEPLTTGEERNLLRLGLRVPNITHPDAPIGPEGNARVLSIHGPERLKPHIARDHYQIAKQLELVDFDAAATTTGSSWYFLKGAAALLEQALVNYALSVAIRYGYTPMSTPDVIRSDIAARCGFSPRDEPHPDSSKIIHHLYHLESTSNDLVLAGTAEIPLAGMHA